MGGVLLAASAVISTLNISAMYPTLANYNLTASTIAALVAVIGAVFLILGILDLVVGIGFLGGKGWAWTLGMIVAVLNIIGAIFQLFVSPGFGVVWLIIWIGILYYLTRTRVKAFFGKAPWGPAPSMSSPAMGTGAMTAMTAPSTSPTMIKCPNCGTSVVPGTTKCPACGASL